MTLGQQIMIARKNKKLSQKQLGKLIGMSDMQISNIECDKHKPHSNNLKKISEALGVKFEV